MLGHGVAFRGHDGAILRIWRMRDLARASDAVAARMQRARDAEPAGHG